MNWQSGSLINDFQFLLWVIGDTVWRTAEQSWPRGRVTVSRFYLLVKHVLAEKLAQMAFPHSNAHHPSAVACPSSHTVTGVATSVQSTRVH